jgi:hypothetical protein
MTFTYKVLVTHTASIPLGIELGLQQDIDYPSLSASFPIWILHVGAMGYDGCHRHVGTRYDSRRMSDLPSLCNELEPNYPERPLRRSGVELYHYRLYQPRNRPRAHHALAEPCEATDGDVQASRTRHTFQRRVPVSGCLVLLPTCV